jgi:hypothetical protein
MASRFWVGGTGTWDASDTTHWSATTGGAGGASVPGSGDTVTLDASSGGGTVTVNTTVNVTSITMGAFTGTLDFATNDNTVTLSTFSNSGTGTRTLNMGDGLWTITATTGTVWSMGTVTGLTFNKDGANIVASATAISSRVFAFGAAMTYNNFTVTNASYNANHILSSGGVFTNFTLTNVGGFQPGTLTINGALTVSGQSATAPIFFGSPSVAQTITFGASATMTLNYLLVGLITKAGALATNMIANNSYDGGSNTLVTINNPVGNVSVIGS